MVAASTAALGVFPSESARGQAARGAPEKVERPSVESGDPGTPFPLLSGRRGGAPSVSWRRPGAAPTPASLPTGGDKTGVSSQAIALPQGTGKVQGMGESFSAQLSTGVATFTVPFSLPHARGGAQPSLALAYSSGGGHGLAGVGWDVGWPYVARQTERGLPGYDDRADWHPEQDRFVFNGGQELVPICVVHGTTCAATLPAGEAMPAWADGWQYFRVRVEGAFQRFFWSPDHRTWRVQSKSGESLELGVPLDGSGYSGALEADPGRSGHVFRWNLVRQYDDEGTPPPAGAAAPAPVNGIQYRYVAIGDIAYLADVYSTPPANGASTAPLAAYAQHTHLAYEPRPDATTSYRRGWPVRQTVRLAGVDVTSVPFAGGARRSVRRYHLAYDPASHVSLLTGVTLEGRCDGSELNAPAESATTQELPPVTGCPALPPMTFEYQHVTPFHADGTPGAADLAGYEGFDERIVPMQGSPPNSVDEDLADLFDVNSDGLPDLVVTSPGGDGKFPLYLSGAGGAADTFRPARLGVRGVLGATPSTLRLNNDNLAACDVDGDGTIDWLHQPAVRSYAVYTPQLLADGWNMVGRAVPVSALQDPRLDLGDDTPDIDVFDANGDGLVDVVRATGAEMQTFFSLGRYPGGDGSFGSAKWTGPTTATLSLAAVSSCVPLVAAGVPVRFGDSTIRLGDMNGDGLTDIVYVNQGDVRYWPGRGDGSWGTGPLGACAGGFAEGTYVAMDASPAYSDPSGSGLRLDDVNGDGLDDLVQVRFDAIDLWLNVDGEGFTPRHVIAGVVPAQGPLWASKVRLADVNGSGTRDILWGEGGKYRYIDLAGGERPWVLIHVDNGLGKTTDIGYASSTALMLAAEAAGDPWQSTAPMPLYVVTSSTERDNLQEVGGAAGEYVTAYDYRDPVYDGRQREFRGFRTATARRWGDANSPTSVATSQFLLGECADDGPAPAGLTSVCSAAGRWADNPREALKGLPVVEEAGDGSGVYASTSHHAYTLVKLYDGLDGRAVRAAFEEESDSWRYDTAPFTPGGGPATIADVRFESPGASPYSATLAQTTIRAAAGTAHVKTVSAVDPFGNPTDSYSYGCVDGAACPTSDGTIHKATPWSVVPGDASGWLWRTSESYVDGLSGEKRNHTLLTYDPNGHLTTTRSELAGSLPLDRFHQVSGAPTAGAVAPGASQDGILLTAQSAYDPFGNVVAAATPNGRCHAIEYASDYADLPTREHIYVGADGGGTCGSLAAPRGATDLITSAAYDRGLATVSDVSDLHGERTQFVHDDFGRLAQASQPSPSTLGAISSLPSAVIDYDLATPGRPYSIIHTRAQNGASDADAAFRESFAYVDGLGRTIVTLDQADPGADGHAWVVHGLTTFDAKGAERRRYLAAFWDGDPRAYPLAQVPAAPYSSHRYDAFGRAVQEMGLDGAVTQQSAYHALSVDLWDANDLAPGPHAGSYATMRKDGHGRDVSVVERIHVGGGIEAHETRKDLLPTGETYRLVRTRGKGDDVVRWYRYDTLGRLVLNVEPNATRGFTVDPSADPASLKTWRYAYDDAADLVGTSDARGCGSDYYYDDGGRLIVEDYSPCLASQPGFTRANPSTGDGAEVFYQYDGLPPALASQASSGGPDAGAAPGYGLGACVIDPRLQAGRLVVVSDRGARTVTTVDGRGRTTCIARQVTRPGAPAPSPDARYAPTWFSKTIAYDGADRKVEETTGAVALLDAASEASALRIDYTARGTIRRVASSYGEKDATGWADLVSSVTHDADGLVERVVYGDAAHTTTASSYDGRRRLASVQTYRAPAPAWTASPPAYLPPPSYGAATPTTFQLLLEDTDYAYDAADQPVEIRDWRTPSDWPAGAQPVTRKLRYDDLSRVSRVDYQYPAGGDAWLDPFDAEDRGTAKEQDPRRAAPSPHLTFANRPVWQAFAYDWLGNTSGTSDDANGFVDRSLGAITNGTSGQQPYQIKRADGGTGARGGTLTAAYDDAGNVVGLVVVRDPGAPCLPSGAPCPERYAYDWDEVGRLLRARRWDGASLGGATDPLPSAVPAADLTYAYDFADNRALKTAVDAQGHATHSVYVLDTLELRRAPFDGTSYEDSVWTEVVYLRAGELRLGRVHYAATDVPTDAAGPVHVLLELPDHLGSSSVVVDRATGELVERSTYLPYGAAESDYRPDRWDAYRDDYRFTGKEEDVEVGLLYFGKRYLNPTLGRWMSVDPTTIHESGADLNGYAYVHGRLLSASDPVGLEERGESPSGVLQGIQPAQMVPTPPQASSSWSMDLGPYTIAPVESMVNGRRQVVYYSAYNRSNDRFEWAIGPGQFEDFAKAVNRLANLAHDLGPLLDRPMNKAAARMGSEILKGNVLQTFFALGDSWEAARHDPQFVIDSAISLTVGFAGAKGYTTLSGHGTEALDVQGPAMLMPKGKQLVLTGPPGGVMSDPLGNAIETGTLPKFKPYQVINPGEPIPPGLTLHAPVNPPLNIGNGAGVNVVTVGAPTAADVLVSQVRPGTIFWNACRQFTQGGRGLKPTTVVNSTGIHSLVK